MNEFKEMFWKDDEDAFQYHPTKDNYINNNEYTLHVWRPLEQQIPIPPSILVGIRLTHLEEDKQKMIDLQKSIGSPLTDKEIELLIATATPERRKEINNKMGKMNLNELFNLCQKFGY